MKLEKIWIAAVSIMVISSFLMVVFDIRSVLLMILLTTIDLISWTVAWEIDTQLSNRSRRWIPFRVSLMFLQASFSIATQYMIY